MCYFPLFVIIALVSSKVIELDESFLQLVNEGPWLVNFYAHWCGHCRRFSPIYEEVGEYLAKVAPSIKVGRIDASNYVAVSKRFDVDGFPTIKFIDRDTTFTYDGDRSSHNVGSFALRAYGPAVKRVICREDFSGNVTLFDDDPYFVLIEPPESYLKAEFYEVAGRFRLLTWFLTTSHNVLPSHLASLSQDAMSNGGVIVFKDSGALAFPGTQDGDRLDEWVLRERYPVFFYFGQSDLWEFGYSELSASSYIRQDASSVNNRTHPRLVALFLVRSTAQNDDVTNRFLELGRSLARQRLKQLRAFQFGWTYNHPRLSELAMIDLTAPSLVVMDPVTQLFYVNANETVTNGLITLEQQATVEFLLAIGQGNAKSYGGNSIVTRFRRFGRRLSADLSFFIVRHPLVTLAMFGLPALLLSGVVYLCCCVDERYDELDEQELLTTDPHDPHDESTASGITIGSDTHGHMGSAHGPCIPVRKRTLKQCTDIGPVESKDVVDARHSAYKELKKTK